MITPSANSLWLASSLPEAWAFWRATSHVAATQERLLLATLRRNATTAFGQAHGFAAIDSVEQYQRQVPLATYDDIKPFVERVAADEGGVLTAEPVLLLEPTSGSTAARKLIPYTATLKAEFGRGLAPWVADLFRHDPQLLLGSAYWSISPVARLDERSIGGLPIGFEDDGAYLGRVGQLLTSAVMAVPADVRFLADVDTFRYVTLLFLLRRADLALVSVWNPTFLTLLLARLDEWWPRLAADISEGTLTPPGPIPPDLHRRLAALNRPNPQRGYAIAAAFANATAIPPAQQPSSLPHQQIPTKHSAPSAVEVISGSAPLRDNLGAVASRLWPRLRLLSCWADAHAARLAPAAARLLPHATLQGKGLLATEGFVSFPLVGRPAAALSIRSHFFEFIPTDGSPIRLAHELEPEGVYEVVLTTGGGLYRYQLHDLVEVVGKVGQCPLLRFVGKAAHLSDWFGEKLNERHVREALDSLLTYHSIDPTFAMLACDEYAPGRHAYTLFIEVPAASPAALDALTNELETALATNYHYRYCRHLGQLDHLRLQIIPQGSWQIYLATCQALGQRLGDIKPVALHSAPGWLKAFQG